MNGGGIVFEGKSILECLKDFIFVRNKASEFGGGIYMNSFF